MEHANQQYLMFSLGDETFGIAIEQVREIIEYPGLTTIPLTPAFMRGVINLRGAVVPVVDLSVRFGRSATAIQRRSCVVVIESPTDAEQRPLGIIVDGVTEVVDIAPEQIEQRPDFGSGLRADFVASVLKRENGFVLILNLAEVLSFTELESLIAAPAHDSAPLALVANG
ncbi:MAG TPA: chemotaxis protein CheW [Spongiibacteraceae bacterium]|nr:chemotaxis protein CheW [Spongiibacteraceae bacterium]